MSSPDKLRRDADRGARAAALLENDLLQESFAKLRQTLIEELISCDIHDRDAEMFLKTQIITLDTVKESLQIIAATGEFSAKELLTTHKGN